MIPRPAYLSVDSGLTTFFERLQTLRDKYPRLSLSAIADAMRQCGLDPVATDAELQRLTIAITQ